MVQIFNQLIKQERLVRLFEIALAVGNYLNGTSSKGGAYGFKFDIIEKLIDLKAIDNKKNLLMYVIQLTEEQIKAPFFK